MRVVLEFSDVFEVPFWTVLTVVMIILVLSFSFVGKFVNSLEKVSKATR